MSRLLDVSAVTVFEKFLTIIFVPTHSCLPALFRGAASFFLAGLGDAQKEKKGNSRNLPVVRKSLRGASRKFWENNIIYFSQKLPFSSLIRKTALTVNQT